MKRFWIVALVMSLILVFGQIAMGAGNEWIPGSRDGEGTLGKDGKSVLGVYFTTDIVMEGDSSDAYEHTLRVPDPGSDIVTTFPATTGTLMTTGDAGSLTDTTDANILISNGVIMQSVTMSGDATIANSGALAISASAVESSMIAIANVTAPDLFMNTVTITIPAAEVGTDLAMEPGSFYMGSIKVSGFSNVFTLNRDLPVGGNILEINTSAHTGNLIMNAIFFRPAP